MQTFHLRAIIATEPTHTVTHSREAFAVVGAVVAACLVMAAIATPSCVALALACDEVARAVAKAVVDAARVGAVIAVVERVTATLALVTGPVSAAAIGARVV
jgi:hypothetical protein